MICDFLRHHVAVVINSLLSVKKETEGPRKGRRRKRRDRKRLRVRKDVTRKEMRIRSADGGMGGREKQGLSRGRKKKEKKKTEKEGGEEDQSQKLWDAEKSPDGFARLDSGSFPIFSFLFFGQSRLTRVIDVTALFRCGVGRACDLSSCYRFRDPFFRLLSACQICLAATLLSFSGCGSGEREKESELVSFSVCRKEDQEEKRRTRGAITRV